MLKLFKIKAVFFAFLYSLLAGAATPSFVIPQCTDPARCGESAPSVDVLYERAVAFTLYGRGKEYYSKIRSDHNRLLDLIESSCIERSPRSVATYKLIYTILANGSVGTVSIVEGDGGIPGCIAEQFIINGKYPEHDLGYFEVPVGS